MNCGNALVGNPNLNIALAHVRSGFTVIPCKLDKHPYLKGWPDAGTKDESTIHNWWQSFPDAVAGLPCGPNGLFVVDCDREERGPDGVATFQAGCSKAQIDLSACFTVETPSTGRHYYFRAPDAPLGNTVGKLGEGIDTRGIGGYVVAPGSVLSDGREYRVLQGRLETLPPLPETIRTYLLERKHTPNVALAVAGGAVPKNGGLLLQPENVVLTATRLCHPR